MTKSKEGGVRVERPVRHTGRAAYRIKQNPLEDRFATAWRQEQENGLLEYLMGDGYSRGPVTEQDELVAATVIQWLGSPVGQAFLLGLKSKA